MPRVADVLQGTLDLLILTVLSVEPTHGWGIVSRIQRMSRDTFRLGQGSLYPALHRCERRGWLTSYWKTTEHNRIARYYQLTPPGHRARDEAVARWRRYTAAVNRVLDAP